MIDLVLRAIRRVLKWLDIRLEHARHGAIHSTHTNNGQDAAIESFLRSLSISSGARLYLAEHLARLVRTLTLVPPNGQSALELGSYVYGSAVLQRVLGYRRVRGAYYSPAPGLDRKSLAIAGQPDFELDVDLFDAERHLFPYANGAFDLVLCGELIEHLVLDPMHLLFECHRVLGEGGALVLTTPNAASLHAVSSALHGQRSPQVFAKYPAPGNPDVPHVREYTAGELGDALIAAGFELEALFTEHIPGFDNSRWAQNILSQEGFDTSLRGEQTYCVARRRAALPRDRHPRWLYADGPP